MPRNFIKNRSDLGAARCLSKDTAKSPEVTEVDEAAP